MKGWRRTTVSARAWSLFLPVWALSVGGCAQVGGVALSPDVSIQMHAAFGDLLEIRRALIMGDLDAVRLPASDLASHTPHPELPRESLAHVRDVKAEARRAAEASDLSAAARASAAVAGACGACHAENGVGPDFIIGDPPDRPGMTTHMIRYSWGLNRYWQALIAPSDEAWSAGTQILEGTRIAPEEFARRGLDQEDAASMAGAVQEIGQRARGATTREAREGILAELWVICADCHRMLDLAFE